MFCTRCGAENPDGAIYCISCGNATKGSQGTYGSAEAHRDSTAPTQKSVGLGIVFSALIVGLGHLYAERIEMGIILLFIYAVLMAGMLFVLSVFMNIIFLLLVVALWIWALYDVRNTIKEYNKRSCSAGAPPW